MKIKMKEEKIVEIDLTNQKEKIKKSSFIAIFILLFTALSVLTLIICYSSSLGIAWMLMIFFDAPWIFLYTFPENIILFFMFAVPIFLTFKIIKSKFFQSNKEKIEKIIHYFNLILIIIISIYVVGSIFTILI